MDRKIITIGATFGALAVIIGAFGAHALKAQVSSDMLGVFDTGVKYQFYHAFAIILSGVLFKQYTHQNLIRAAIFFSIGILCFSGSVYFIATKEIHQIGIGIFGLITPIGGLMFIVGWILMILSIRNRQ